MNIQKGDQYKVHKDYNQVAEWFDKHRSRDGYEKKYLDMVCVKIPSGGTILDLGCGMGEPVTQYLIQKGYEVTGVEGSGKLITMARDRYPHTEFVYVDIRFIDFNRTFDAIILWHSFFHLSGSDQKNMFPVFTKHLKPGGILLFTSGPQAGEVWSDNGGIDMYHVSLSADDYKWQLQEYHFTLLEHVVEDPECGDATVWIAQYVPPLL